MNNYIPSNPNKNVGLVINNDHDFAGKISVVEGVLTFEGNADAAANGFLNFLKEKCLFDWQKLQHQNNELVAENADLQQKLDAVTAEAAYLRDQIKQHSQSTHFCEICGKDDPCENDDVCWSLKHPTPATDAIINVLRAEGAPVIQDRDLKALRRFNETSEDSQGYDIGDEAMDRLIEIGLVAKERGKMRVVTTFGLWVLLGPSNDVLPILSTQRDRDIAFNERIAKLRNGEHVTKDGE